MHVSKAKHNERTLRGTILILLEQINATPGKENLASR